MNNIAEEWKSIVGYEGRYEISTHGRVKSIIRTKTLILKPLVDLKGYLQVNLRDGQKSKMFKIHHLVLDNFKNTRPLGYQACHNDGNNQNNHLYNLRWDTPSNNQLDRIKHGTSNRGNRHPLASLREDDIIKIRQLHSKGLSSKEIYQIIQKTSPKNIRRIIKGGHGGRWVWLK